MNLKLIDRVIKSYNDELSEGDMKRLEFFYGLWEDMDRWSKGPTTAEKHYTVPSEEQLEEAWIASKPVFSFAPPKLSKERFAAICYSLREYVCEQGGLPEEDAKAFREVNFRTIVEQGDMELAATDPEAFIGGLLSNAYVQEVPDAAAHMVALVGMLALRVDLELVAKEVVKRQRSINKMNHNPLTCPVCGSAPALAKVGGDSPTDGRGRTLYCQQCGTEWAFERIRCARCGSQNPQHLHYFNVEGDEAHRIYKCDECGGYTRTVFMEDALRPFSFEVEEVVTARLDAIARDPKFQAQD